ncbi:MAG TPA: amidase, partial [Cytophagales bacterium]|nr:amidase [Cytophagales bacterium]
MKRKSFILLALVLGVMLGAFVPWEDLVSITTTDVAAAEKLIGLELTEAERGMAIPSLENYREAFQQIRQVPLDNGVMPAMQFDPLPIGWQPTNDQQPILWEYPETERPTSAEAIAFLTVPEQAALLKSRQITSVELTKIYIDRIKTYGDTLQCLITLMEEEALAQARSADAEMAAGNYRGMLHGIPYGVKDLFAYPGTKTTWGAGAYKDQEIEAEATVISKLNAAGGVLLAKLTLGALAMGDVWYGGVTKNPWKLDQGSSGSSAGSASATAAGLVGFSIGTETWGSIVSPSTRCG